MLLHVRVAESKQSGVEMTSLFESKKKHVEQMLEAMKPYAWVEMYEDDEGGHIEIDGVTFYYDENREITSSEMGL